MSEYRDELAAAHSRIAELEEKVRALEEDAKPKTFDGRFPELEREVARLRAAADPTSSARRRTQLSIFGAIFPLAVMVFSFLHQPIAATVCSVIFIGIIGWNMTLMRRLKTSTKRLAEVETKLATHSRIAELETKLADARVRVASSSTAPLESAVEEDDPSAAAERRRA